jgi:excisionase family DNA binding protein
VQHFNIHIELGKQDPTEQDIIQLRDFLEQGNLHPAVGISPRGYLSARVTIPAVGLVQAVMVAVATVQQDAGAEAIAVEAMTEKEFDAREGFVPIPELLSVQEAADVLGKSRQRILQMINNHEFPSAQQVGNAWVIAHEDVEAKRN